MEGPFENIFFGTWRIDALVGGGLRTWIWYISGMQFQLRCVALLNAKGWPHSCGVQTTGNRNLCTKMCGIVAG